MHSVHNDSRNTYSQTMHVVHERSRSSEDLSIYPCYEVIAPYPTEKIEAGYDADIVIWNPEEEFKVEKENILHRHKVTPYLNELLKGVVKQTYVNGKLVYNNGDFKELDKGKLILNR